MKKQHIYNEFMRIAKEMVGDNRMQQKFYVMQMCEQLGRIDHKESFVLWCSRKRVLAYQYGKTDAQPQKNGTYWLFAKSDNKAIVINNLKN